MGQIDAKNDKESSPLSPKAGHPQGPCCGGMSSLLVVQVIAFFYNMGFIMSNSTNEQYASYYSASIMGGDTSLLTVGLCSLGNTSANWVAAVQSRAANFLSVFSLLNNLLMLPAAIVLGAYSDGHGRKVIMCLPVIGGLIRGAIALGVQLTFADIKYMWAGAGIEGIVGGSAVLTLALYAYMADVSSPASRAMRMVWLFVAESLGIAVAEIAVGYIITYSGFMYPFILIILAYTICLVLICAFLKESVRRPDETPCCSFRYVIEPFRLLCRWTEQGWTLVLWAAAATILLVYAAQGISAFALYLYVAQVLCFTWVEVGFLIAVASLVHVLGSPLAVRLFSGCLQDTAIVALAALDGVIGQVYLAIPVISAAYIYCQPLVAFMAGTIMPLTRSIMANAVGPHEQGAIQGIAALCNIAGLMMGSVSATKVYAATSQTFQGAVFIYGASVFLLILGCALFMHFRIRRMSWKPSTEI